MKITIIETKTISTEIEVEADSVEQAQKLYNEGEYSDEFSREELEQWNVIDDKSQFLVDDEIVINWEDNPTPLYTLKVNEDNMKDSSSKTYLLVDTWNGEGYSSENGVQIKKYSCEHQAYNDAEEFVKRQVNFNKGFVPKCESLHEHPSVEFYDDNSQWGDGRLLKKKIISYSVGEDYGSYQILEFNQSNKIPYGVKITTSLNEVEVLTKEEYFEEIDNLITKVTEHDCSEAEELEEQRKSQGEKFEPFISAEYYNGDCDYQFRLIK
tara:strand:- start:14123 stop:14923 length:801 start_codon:yes stop_codon:yes gene_type:complete